MKKINPIEKYFLTLISSFRTNIRDYGMYIALVVIFIVFSAVTGGLFLGPQNFTNLLNQTAYVAVLTVTMTLVIVTRQIDLSVGYLGAFLGAYVVVAVETRGWSVLAALAVGLLITIVIGIIKGLLVAKVKVPSFVVTLAAMFIFKGLLMNETDNKTIPTSNKFFIDIGTSYLSEGQIGRYNTLTLIVGVTLILLVIIAAISKRRNNIKLGIKVESLSMMITKLVFLVAIVGFLTYTLAAFRGISYALLITVVVVIIFHIISTQTVIGRKIYAVGGNPEAAELSGISVATTIVIVFVAMGILSLVAGVMFVSNVQNASPQHGVSWELYAIASAYIGGTSANGGAGKVINSAVGAVTITALTNGMILAGINSNLEPIIQGSVLALSVIFDIYTRNVRPIDFVGVHYAKKSNKENYEKAKEEYHDARVALNKAYSEFDSKKVDKLQKELLERKAAIKLARKQYGRDDKTFINAKSEYEKASNALKLSLKERDSDLISQLEYELTKKEGDFNRIKDLIRSAKEEDYIQLFER